MITRSLNDAEIVALAPRLLHLQHSAYAIEAALIGDDRIPPLHEGEQELVSAQLGWLVTLDADRLAGAVGYVIEDDVVAIDRLMIAPEYHRQGVGAGLVARFWSWLLGRSFRRAVKTLPPVPSTPP